MRKHIVIVSEESIYAGNYKCGIGEVVDCMASVLRNYYDVTVLTIGKRQGGKAYGQVTMGVEGEEFYAAAAEWVNDVQPDLVHNFGRPDFISRLSVECPKVLTFDRWEDVADNLEYVPGYDHVTTLSTAYANEVIAEHTEAGEWPLKGIINGIDSSIYGPFDGDKAAARSSLLKKIGKEDSGKKIVVSMGRLKPVKGTDLLIADAEAIAAAGVELIVWGTGDAEFEQNLTDLHEAGTLHYFHRMCDYFEMMSALRGADFYLTPSRSEVCGLQPMKAARVGCVPIVTPVGGMAENFDESTAVLITDGIADAVQRAVAMDEDAYEAMKRNCQNGEWTWDTRILPWIELYGLPTAPRETVAATYSVRETASASTFAMRDNREVEKASYPCPFAKKEG